MARWLRLACAGFLAVTLFCCGCWDNVELQRRALVVGAAVDMTEEGQYRLTLQVIKPQPGKTGGTGAQYLDISGTGVSVAEAERVIDRQIPDLLFYAAQRILIVSQDAAKPGISDILDMFLREREPRETMFFAMAEGTASDVLLADNLGPIPAYGLANMIEEQSSLAEAPVVNLLDVTNAIDGEGAPYAPLLVVHNESGMRHAMLAGTQVFDNDMPVGTLDFTATRGLLWTLGHLQGGIAPLTGSIGSGQVTLAVISLASAIKASVSGDAPLAVIELEVEADVVAATDSAPTGTTKGLAELEVVAADKMREDINAALAAAKELCVDLFDIGDIIRATHPAQWKKIMKEWPEKLKDLKTDIRITMSVERTGLIKSVHQPQ